MISSGVNRHGLPRTLGAALLAGTALRSTGATRLLRPLLSLALALSGRALRRRQSRVPRVLPQAAFQFPPPALRA